MFESVLTLLQQWRVLTPTLAATLSRTSPQHMSHALRHLAATRHAISLGRMAQPGPFLAGYWFAYPGRNHRYTHGPCRFHDGSMLSHTFWVTSAAAWLVNPDVFPNHRHSTLVSEWVLRYQLGWFYGKPPSRGLSLWASYVPDFLFKPTGDLGPVYRIEVQIEPKPNLWPLIDQGQNDTHPTLILCPTRQRTAYYLERIPPNHPHVRVAQIGDVEAVTTALAQLKAKPACSALERATPS